MGHLQEPPEERKDNPGYPFFGDPDREQHRVARRCMVTLKTTGTGDETATICAWGILASSVVHVLLDDAPSWSTWPLTSVVCIEWDS